MRLHTLCSGQDKSLIVGLKVRMRFCGASLFLDRSLLVEQNCTDFHTEYTDSFWDAPIYSNISLQWITEFKQSRIKKLEFPVWTCIQFEMCVYMFQHYINCVHWTHYSNSKCSSKNFHQMILAEQQLKFYKKLNNLLASSANMWKKPRGSSFYHSKNPDEQQFLSLRFNLNE